MALAETIEAVSSGKSPEEARLESVQQKTPFMERMLKVIKSVPEKAVRKAAGIDKMDLPEDFNAAGGFAKSVYEQISDPIKAALARGREKNAMPMKQSGIEHLKDTATVFKEVAKAGGRIVTSGVDAIQMAARNKIDPVDWEKIPILKNIPSYQRQAQLKVEAGVPLSEVVANAVRDIGVDLLSTYGSTKAVQKIDKTLSGGSVVKPTKYIQNELSPKTRMKVINDAVKSGDIPKNKILVDPKKTLARPEVVKGRLEDYALVLDKEAGKAVGNKLRKAIDVNKVHYRNGKFVEIHREAHKLLKDTKTTNVVEGGAAVKVSPKKKTQSAPDFNYGVKRTPEEQAIAERNMDSFRTQIDLEKKDLIQKR